ncbi:MAG: hypothetical protein BWK78_08700 [Thiotrichaceae bacterium IS1]|nr:MAG: hypothetical protein BWK78_08700 [Thiotrichaceae bacterium IS1]
MKYNYLPHTTAGKSLISKALLSIGLLLATFFKKAIYPLVRCNTHLPACQTGPADRRLQHPLRWWQFCWHGRITPSLAMFFLSLLVVSNPGVCAEADDKAGGANPINLDQEVSGIFGKNNSTDFYTFELPADGNVTITLKHGVVGSKYHISGHLYHENDLGNDLHGFQLDDTRQSISVQEGLPAGIYYLKFVRFSAPTYSDEPYQFTVAFEVSDFYEKSPNGKAETATPMILNQEYAANLHDSSDKDFYKITLPSAGNVTITLNSPEGNGQWAIYLYQSGNLSSSLHDLILGQEVHSASIQEGLAAGDYYLEVLSRAGLWDSGQYHLTVTFEASDFYEKSPNDKTDTATPMVFLDKPYTGNLSSDSDKDFYKFTLSTAGNVTFTLAQDNPSPLKSGDWKATVYPDGNFSDPGLLFFSLRGEVESNSVTKELVAGDYYLKISRPDYFYSSDQYHITVSTSNVGDESTVGDIPITGDTGNTEGSATPLEETAELTAKQAEEAKARNLGIDVDNISYQLYLVKEGTAVLPISEEIPVSYNYDINVGRVFLQRCVHGEKYSLRWRIVNPSPLLDTTLIITRGLKLTTFESSGYTEKTVQPEGSFQPEGLGVFSTAVARSSSETLAEITCQHQDWAQISYNDLDVLLTSSSDEKYLSSAFSVYLSKIGKNNNITSGTIVFIPETSIQDILKRDVKFSSEFSPSNAVLAATLSELAYYNEDVVKPILEAAGFTDVVFYELKGGWSLSDFQVYIATKKYTNQQVPIIYVIIRGTTLDLGAATTSSLKDVLTDVDAIGYDSASINLFLLGYDSVHGLNNPYADGFYDYADFAYNALKTYPQKDGDFGQPIINVYNGKAKLFIVGHSLGGATANILTTLLGQYIDTDNMMTYTIGAPRSIGIGWLGMDLTTIINNSDFNIFTIRHHDDLVPTIPTNTYFGYGHVGNLIGLYQKNASITVNQYQTDADVGYLIIEALSGFGPHSSDVYVNSLLHVEKTSLGGELEKTASEKDIFDRGLCGKISPLTGIPRNCYIHATLIGTPTRYIDGVAKNSIFLGKVNKFRNEGKPYEVYQALSFDNNISGLVIERTEPGKAPTSFMFDTATELLSLLPFDEIVKRCRVYANGDLTCFNPTMQGSPMGINLYFKLDSESPVPGHRLWKQEPSTSEFHFINPREYHIVDWNW